MRNVKNGISSLVEGAWAHGFTLAGRFLRPRAARWTSPGKQRILIIAPHPDDEAIGCAGTILRHKQCGDEVWIAFVTDGRGSRALGLGPDEMARQRRQEADAVTQVLGTDHAMWFDLPEGAWTVEQLQPHLRSLFDQFAPHIVYAPSRIDFHPEHHKVADALAACLCAMNVRSSQLLIRIYQVQVPLTPILTNLVTPTSGVVAEINAVLKVYVTQLGSIASTIRMRRYTACLYRLDHQAEAFWQITPAAYALIHNQPSDVWSLNAFRGLRPRPLSDPLAYLQGRSERKRLMGLVRDEERIKFQNA